MPCHIIQEVVEKAPQDIPLAAPGIRRKRVASMLRASWCILRHWRPAFNHRPPEMHAVDHLAKDYPNRAVPQ
jgi:hypothetical protein